MPTEQTEAVSKKVSDAAKIIEEQILRLQKSASKYHHDLGYLIIEVRKKNVWEVRGFESENAYREFLDVGRSTWYRTGKLIGELAPIIPKSVLMRISLENMDHLIKLGTRERKNKIWWKRAIEMKEYEFEEAVLKALPKDEDGEAISADTAEERVQFKIYMYVSQRELITNVVKDFNKENSIPLDDIGRGLELICVEVANNKQSMVAAVRNVVLPKLKAAHELVNKSEKSADEIREQVGELLGNAVLALAAVTESAKKGAAA